MLVVFSVRVLKHVSFFGEQPTPRCHRSINLVLAMPILFDSDSRQSYITERTKERLGVFPKIKEKLLIKTFGKENEDLQDCGIVEFCVRGLSQSLGVQMTALTAPLICSKNTAAKGSFIV